MKKILVLLVLFNSIIAASTCKKFIELHSAEWWSGELQRPVSSILSSHRIFLWSKTTPEGKGKIVGKMIPGSNAKIISEKSEDYRVVSPFDGSVGWVNKMQVSRTVYRNEETLEYCKPKRKIVIEDNKIKCLEYRSKIKEYTEKAESAESNLKDLYHNQVSFYTKKSIQHECQ